MPSTRTKLTESDATLQWGVQWLRMALIEQSVAIPSPTSPPLKLPFADLDHAWQAVYNEYLETMLLKQTKIRTSMWGKMTFYMVIALSLFCDTSGMHSPAWAAMWARVASWMDDPTWRKTTWTKYKKSPQNPFRASLHEWTQWFRSMPLTLEGWAFLSTQCVQWQEEGLWEKHLEAFVNRKPGVSTTTTTPFQRWKIALQRLPLDQILPCTMTFLLDVWTTKQGPSPAEWQALVTEVFPVAFTGTTAFAHVWDELARDVIIWGADRVYGQQGKWHLALRLGVWKCRPLRPFLSMTLCAARFRRQSLCFVTKEMVPIQLAQTQAQSLLVGHDVLHTLNHSTKDMPFPREQASEYDWSFYQVALVPYGGGGGISGGICKSPHTPKPGGICKSPHTPKPGVSHTPSITSSLSDDEDDDIRMVVDTAVDFHPPAGADTKDDSDGEEEGEDAGMRDDNDTATTVSSSSSSSSDSSASSSSLTSLPFQVQLQMHGGGHGAPVKFLYGQTIEQLLQQLHVSGYHIEQVERGSPIIHFQSLDATQLYSSLLYMSLLRPDAVARDRLETTLRTTIEIIPSWNTQFKVSPTWMSPPTNIRARVELETNVLVCEEGDIDAELLHWRVEHRPSGEPSPWSWDRCVDPTTCFVLWVVLTALTGQPCSPEVMFSSTSETPTLTWVEIPHGAEPTTSSQAMFLHLYETELSKCRAVTTVSSPTPRFFQTAWMWEFLGLLVALPGIEGGWTRDTSLPAIDTPLSQLPAFVHTLLQRGEL